MIKKNTSELTITVRNVTLTNTNIDFIYNLYVNSIIELARVCPVVEVGIFDKSPNNPVMDKNNPYLTENDDWIINLGRSVVKNGTQDRKSVV